MLFSQATVYMKITQTSKSSTSLVLLSTWRNRLEDQREQRRTVLEPQQPMKDLWQGAADTVGLPNVKTSIKRFQVESLVISYVWILICGRFRDYISVSIKQLEIEKNDKIIKVLQRNLSLLIPGYNPAQIYPFVSLFKVMSLDWLGIKRKSMIFYIGYVFIRM